MTAKVVFERYGVQLKEIQADQIEMIRLWRNSPEINQQMLTQIEITPEMQQAWYAGLAQDKSKKYLLAWFKNEPIGVVSLLNINLHDKSAEPGMYIYPERYRQNIVPFCVGFCLNDYAFEQLQLEVLLGKILDTNEASKRFHIACGYELYAQEQAQNQTQSSAQTPADSRLAQILRQYADMLVTATASTATRSKSGEVSGDSINSIEGETLVFHPYYLTEPSYRTAMEKIARFIRYD